MRRGHVSGPENHRLWLVVCARPLASWPTPLVRVSQDDRGKPCCARAPETLDEDRDAEVSDDMCTVWPCFGKDAVTGLAGARPRVNTSEGKQRV